MFGTQSSLAPKWGSEPAATDLKKSQLAHVSRHGSDLLKALSHEGRLTILALLAEQERSVTELETILELRQPAVSQQLARLRADNLVGTRREGKLIYYSLASEQAREVIQVLLRIYTPE
jgi:DNA-binding transcriptional ArsR family regulator